MCKPNIFAASSECAQTDGKNMLVGRGGGTANSNLMPLISLNLPTKIFVS